MMNVKVSIVVPCYCQAEYLAETLDSVLAQTYPNWECVVVNDGSPDDTEVVAKSYSSKDSRFLYFYQENQGLASARNAGIAATDGLFILPLDSDDKIAPTYIEKALEVFNCQPDVKLVYCQAMLFGAEQGVWPLAKYEYEGLLWKNCIFCSALFRREDYNKTRGYNPNMKYGFEDWDFWLSLLMPHDVVYCIDEPLFYYRVKDGSMLKKLQQNNLEKAYKQIYENHRELYEPYMADFQSKIVYYREMQLVNQQLMIELTRSHDEIACMRHSKAYRIGKALTKPFAFLKRKGK